MTVAIAGFFVVADLSDGDPSLFSKDNPSWSAVGFLMQFSPVAGIVAGLLWAAFHRGGRRPAWWGYALLALLVVLISHFVVFGTAMLLDSTNIVRDLMAASFFFVFHGWLSVPVAFVGTALFVWWNRRRQSRAGA